MCDVGMFTEHDFNGLQTAPVLHASRGEKDTLGVFVVAVIEDTVVHRASFFEDGLDRWNNGYPNNIVPEGDFEEGCLILRVLRLVPGRRFRFPFYLQQGLLALPSLLHLHVGRPQVGRAQVVRASGVKLEGAEVIDIIQPHTGVFDIVAVARRYADRPDIVPKIPALRFNEVSRQVYLSGFHQLLGLGVHQEAYCKFADVFMRIGHGPNNPARQSVAAENRRYARFGQNRMAVVGKDILEFIISVGAVVVVVRTPLAIVVPAVVIESPRVPARRYPLPTVRSNPILVKLVE